VVEVVCGIVKHAQLFHDAAGALVRRDGEGDEVGEIEGTKRVMENGAGAFGGEAAAPVVGCETPGDFDGGHEGGFEGWGVEADVADEGSGFCELGGVGAVAVEFEVKIDAVD